MKFLNLFFVLFIFVSAHSQNIRGKVIDEDNQPIHDANVYLDGTSIASSTNARGYFELLISTKTNASLVVSYIGYQTVYLTDYDDSKDLVIVLKKTVNELKEVVIKKDRFTRKEKLQLFKEQFLGTTKAGRNASIKNEADLDFEYDEKNHVFTASAEVPIVIYNPILGYEVSYEINTFRILLRSLSIKSEDILNITYSGYSKFKEISHSNDVMNEREISYQGSTLHFMRSLVTNKLVENKFKLSNNHNLITVSKTFSIKDTLGFKQVRINNFILNNEDKKRVKVPFYAINYANNQNSSISFSTPVFYVDKFGVHTHVNQIFFMGDISKRRIADLLPTNYGTELFEE